MNTLRRILVLLPLLLSMACERNGAATAATTRMVTPVPQPSNPATAPVQSD